MTFEFRRIELEKIITNNFIISPVELRDHIDFEVKRIYFITDIKNATGAHCHKIEKEMFILQKGFCTAVIDRGNGIEEVPMSSPTSAIYVGNFVWHHFKDFSADAVLLALSSTNYSPDRSDYIDDYEEYKEVVKNQ
jgi:hypothetical protein